MATVKHDRIQELIKESASNIVLYELKDPRLGFITITKVDLSPDLRFAKVYYSVLGTDAEAKLTAHAIQHALGHIQREVAKHVHLRFAPEISFVVDDAPRRSVELSQLIDKAVAEDQERRKEHEQAEAENVEPPEAESTEEEEDADEDDE